MKKVLSIKDLSHNLVFVDTDYEVEAIKEYFPKVVGINDFEAFFVRVGDGDYDEVWGIETNIPHLMIKRIG